MQKSVPNNRRRTHLPNQRSNQTQATEALNSEVERCLTKLKTLRIVSDNFSEAQISDDERGNMYIKIKPNVQNHHRLKTIRNAAIPPVTSPDRDKLQTPNKPEIKEPPTIHPRKTIEALRLPPFETTSYVDSYLAQFEICARYNDWTEEDKTAQLKLALKGCLQNIMG